MINYSNTPNPSKPVQESFGQSIIDAITTFARQDLDDVSVLESKYLDHISDADFRRTLAETLYGARWIYKLGLALLVRNEEQMAHVRAQLIDYCSVCEGVLSDMFLHGLLNGHLTGQKYRFKDVYKLTGPIVWNAATCKQELERVSLNWLIVVAAEEGIVDTALKSELHWLRKERNSVHLRARTYKAFLGKSMRAFGCLQDLFNQTKAWKRKHP